MAPAAAAGPWAPPLAVAVPLGGLGDHDATVAGLHAALERAEERGWGEVAAPPTTAAADQAAGAASVPAAASSACAYLSSCRWAGPEAFAAAERVEVRAAAGRLRAAKTAYAVPNCPRIHVGGVAAGQATAETADAVGAIR